VDGTHPTGNAQSSGLGPTGEKTAELDSYWFSTEFRLDRNGELQVRNPRFNYSALDKEAETKRQPWLPVTSGGRYFEYVVCLYPEKMCKTGHGYCLIQGEIVLEEGRTLVIARNYMNMDISKIKIYRGASYIAVYELLP